MYSLSCLALYVKSAFSRLRAFGCLAYVIVRVGPAIDLPRKMQAVRLHHVLDESNGCYTIKVETVPRPK